MEQSSPKRQCTATLSVGVSPLPAPAAARPAPPKCAPILLELGAGIDFTFASTPPAQTLRAETREEFQALLQREALRATQSEAGWIADPRSDLYQRLAMDVLAAASSEAVPLISERGAAALAMKRQHQVLERSEETRFEARWFATSEFAGSIREAWFRTHDLDDVLALQLELQSSSSGDAPESGLIVRGEFARKLSARRDVSFAELLPMVKRLSAPDGDVSLYTVSPHNTCTLRQQRRQRPGDAQYHRVLVSSLRSRHGQGSLNTTFDFSGTDTGTVTATAASVHHGRMAGDDGHREETDTTASTTTAAVSPPPTLQQPAGLPSASSSFSSAPTAVAAPSTATNQRWRQRVHAPVLARWNGVWYDAWIGDSDLVFTDLNGVRNRKVKAGFVRVRFESDNSYCDIRDNSRNVKERLPSPRLDEHQPLLAAATGGARPLAAAAVESTTPSSSTTSSSSSSMSSVPSSGVALLDTFHRNMASIVSDDAADGAASSSLLLHESLCLNPKLYLIWKQQGYATSYHQDTHVPPHLTWYNQVSGSSVFHFLPHLVGEYASFIARSRGPEALRRLLATLDARRVGSLAVAHPGDLVLIRPMGAHGVFVPNVARNAEDETGVKLFEVSLIRAAELFLTPLRRKYKDILLNGVVSEKRWFAWNRGILPAASAAETALLDATPTQMREEQQEWLALANLVWEQWGLASSARLAALDLQEGRTPENSANAEGAPSARSSRFDAMLR